MLKFEQCGFRTDYFSKRCRWNGKHCRPWSDCSWGAVWSGSTLFAQTSLINTVINNIIGTNVFFTRSFAPIIITNPGPLSSTAVNRHMSHVMRKPVLTICEQQRCRSACASTQSDQRLCCSLPEYYNTSSFYIRNFKPLPSFCGCAGQFVSYLVANPEDRFSGDQAHTILWNVRLLNAWYH